MSETRFRIRRLDRADDVNIPDKAFLSRAAAERAAKRRCPGYVKNPEEYEIYPYTSGTPRSAKAADAHPVVTYCLPAADVDYVRELARRQARSMSAVIAEGVESSGQRDFLDRLGCHGFQGYFYSPPLPLAEFERCWLRPITAVQD